MATAAIARPIILSWRERLAAAVLALVAVGTIAAGLLAGFGGLAPQPWLAQTTELVDRLAQCDRQGGPRESIDRCKQGVVLAALEARRAAVKLANR